MTARRDQQPAPGYLQSLLVEIFRKDGWGSSPNLGQTGLSTIRRQWGNVRNGVSLVRADSSRHVNRRVGAIRSALLNDLTQLRVFGESRLCRAEQVGQTPLGAGPHHQMKHRVGERTVTGNRLKVLIKARSHQAAQHLP